MFSTFARLRGGAKPDVTAPEQNLASCKPILGIEKQKTAGLDLATETPMLHHSASFRQGVAFIRNHRHVSSADMEPANDWEPTNAVLVSQELKRE